MMTSQFGHLFLTHGRLGCCYLLALVLPRTFVYRLVCGYVFTALGHKPGSGIAELHCVTFCGPAGPVSESAAPVQILTSSVAGFHSFTSSATLVVLTAF